MIDMIYLDMDGVLCNFERRYFELYGELPGSMRDRKEFSVHWEHFIQTKQFETLDWYPGAQKLLEYCFATGIPIEVLTSSGGNKYHDLVESHKKVWLESHGLGMLKANVVAGRKNKAKFATPNRILIDDTPDVIDSYNAAGGLGILHKEVVNTLLYLDKLLT